METSDDGQKKKGGWVSENSAIVIAAAIGLVSAVLSSTLPALLQANHKQPPAQNHLQPNLAQQDRPFQGAERPWGAGNRAGQSSLPNLSLGVWTIANSVDAEGTDWSQSTLKFTSQATTPTGAQLEGFFEWRNGTRIIGREYVIANLEASTRRLFIEGQYTEKVLHQIATGTYSVTVAKDGQSLVEGTWSNTPGRLAGVPGRWEARR